MKRQLALLALLALALMPSHTHAASMVITVVVNGKALAPDAVEVRADTVYVALRPLAQALEADISTNAQANTVTVTTLLRQVVFHLDDRWATVNGQRVALAAPATRSGSRIVLPLRAVGEAFGATVVYDSRTHEAVVSAALRSTPTPAHAAGRLGQDPGRQCPVRRA